MKRTQKGPLHNVLTEDMRRLRADLSLSQKALADACGIHRTYIGGIERSERNVSIDNIARIADGLGTQAWRLLQDDCDDGGQGEHDAPASSR